jgi:hypothetical protein
LIRRALLWLVCPCHSQRQAASRRGPQCACDPPSARCESFCRLRAISPFISGETVTSILCSKAPRASTLLSELGPRLESLRLARNALIRPALSRN